jgi:hypothetical protein
MVPRHKNICISASGVCGVRFSLSLSLWLSWAVHPKKIERLDPAEQAQLRISRINRMCLCLLVRLATAAWRGRRRRRRGREPTTRVAVA